MYGSGCRASDQKGVIVLDFGQPDASEGEWGTFTFGSVFASIAEIESAIQAYVAGVADCVLLPPNGRLKIAVGTSNFGNEHWGTPEHYVHGAHWADMIDRLVGYVQSRGYDSFVSVVGANDIEAATDWSPPDKTRAWVQGYADAGTHAFYNYGDAGGCGTSPGSGGGACSNGWTQDDLWWVSWGAQPAFALPEIYLNDGTHAAQWQSISLTGALNHSRRILFSGVMTQFRACQTEGCFPDVDNTYDVAWRQLLYALNSDSRTNVEDIDYTTDIGWFE
jgi:hypothetical protein